MNHASLQSHLYPHCFPLGVQKLVIDMMALLKIRLLYGAKKDVVELLPENVIIQGDAFSPLLFFFASDPLIKFMKKK